MNRTTLQAIFQEELYALTTEVLVIIPAPWESITETDRQLLGKILGAVKINVAGVQIIVARDFNLNDVKHLSPRYVISFGSAFEASSKYYEVIPSEGCAVLQADALDQLDDPRKKNLWSALKQMFDV